MRIGAATAAWHFTVMTDVPELSFAADFPRATREQWEALVKDVLKGAPHDRLITTTYDGLRIDPLYSQQPQAPPVAHSHPGAPWRVMQRVDHPEAEAANAEALHDLANGADGLSLVFRGAPAAYGFGLPPIEGALARALTGVRFDEGIHLELDAGMHARDIAASVITIVKKAGARPAATKIRFGFDPIGAAAAAGGSASSWDVLKDALASDISNLADKGFTGPFAAADGRIVHNAGGSEAQELAFALAAAVAYLRAIERGGIALDAARHLIFFRLAADADQFLTMAKLRALRKLWARIEAACGLSPAPLFMSVDTAWRMMSKRDAHVNMVRTCIAVAAAGLGSADAITALPFTMAVGLPDRFARRVARNTQLILIEEAHLAKVMDAAAGAGAIENFTDQLCHIAWALFQRIEQVGGAWAALERGDLQSKIAEVRAQRQADVATRKAPLTGTSDFPNLAEAPVSVLMTAPVPEEAARQRVQFEALPPLRLAQSFEKLRERSDAMLTRNGARPKVFLAHLGSASEFSARANFAKNLFESGGIETVTHEAAHAAPGDDTTLAFDFAQSGTKLACLCSSDARYASQGAAAVERLKNAGAVVWVAGKPMRDLEASGASGFIFAGCDVLAALRKAYASLEQREAG